MRLNKCFTTVFDPALKEHGFKRQGVLYYRINGEILQGITIKTTNPYYICFGCLPYWMYDIYWNFHRGALINRSAWAEDYHYLDGDYYIKDDEDSLKYMQSLLNPIINNIIPILDGLKSNDYFLRFKEHYLEPGSRLTCRIVPQYALMQKALQDHSFSESDRLLEKIIKYNVALSIMDSTRTEDECQIFLRNYYRSSLETLPQLFKPYLQKVEELKQSEEEYAKELKKLDRMMEVHYAKYVAIREKEDFDAIEALYNENLAKMKEEIKNKLKIDL